MVSYNVYKATSSGAYVEGVCLASDEKPVVGIANGSILFAVDASSGETTRYMYDKESMSWIEAECPCSGGGSGSGGSGGGGSSEGVLIVNLSGASLTADKTFGEIEAALNAGRPAYAHQEGYANAMFPIYACTYRDDGAFTGYAAVMFDYSRAPNVRSVSTTNAQGATASDYPSFGT
jgi:hypothetical protein